jgi:hypothetical protein
VELSGLSEEFAAPEKDTGSGSTAAGTPGCATHAGPAASRCASCAPASPLQAPSAQEGLVDAEHTSFSRKQPGASAERRWVGRVGLKSGSFVTRGQRSKP